MRDSWLRAALAAACCATLAGLWRVAGAGGARAGAGAGAGPRGARAGVGDFASVAARHGYAAERHVVRTADSYLLPLFRVRRGRRCVRRVWSVPVLLAHGLLQSAEAWLAAGPGAGLGFLLPDACYDTWAASARGSLAPRAYPEYWQFSTDEMAAYDAPAVVDYVLAATGAERLNYVGFSQGASVALMMLAERPRLARRLGVLVAIAPPTTLARSTSPLNALLAASAALETALGVLGVHHVFGVAAAIRALCGFRFVRDALCRRAFDALDTPHRGSVAEETYETLFDHFPAGASVRTMARYGQAVKTALFRKYDFGELENVKRYGSAQPPAYNLSAVTAPVLLVQGASDACVAVEDTRWVARQLPDLLEFYVVEDPAWNHLDAVYSKHINETMFPIINQYLLKYSTP